MKKNNRTCICCEKVYTYCNRCEEHANEPAWNAIFHEDNCRKVVRVVSDYLGKAITKEEAVEGLKTCDLSVDFKPSIKKVTNDLMSSTEKTVNVQTVEAVENTEVKTVEKATKKKFNREDV